jgi:hypothetical protein
MPSVQSSSAIFTRACALGQRRQAPHIQPKPLLTHHRIGVYAIEGAWRSHVSAGVYHEFPFERAKVYPDGHIGALRHRVRRTALAPVDCR